ncbi:MAG: hypothetical protein ABFS41_13630 [Myxococcota bacterium]
MLRFTIWAGAKKNSGFGPGVARPLGGPVGRADRAVDLQLVGEVVVHGRRDRAVTRHVDEDGGLLRE